MLQYFFETYIKFIDCLSCNVPTMIFLIQFQHLHASHSACRYLISLRFDVCYWFPISKASSYTCKQNICPIQRCHLMELNTQGLYCCLKPDILLNIFATFHLMKNRLRTNKYVKYLSKSKIYTTNFQTYFNWSKSLWLENCTQTRTDATIKAAFHVKIAIPIALTMHYNLILSNYILWLSD